MMDPDDEMAPKLNLAISAAVENGFRLLDDADFLGGAAKTPTALALYILAQEEFGKAFILHLVRAGVLPWDQFIRKALTDHQCKHLMGILMDFVRMSDEEWEFYLERRERARETSNGFYPEKQLSSGVVTAMNYFRHAKVGKWRDHWGYLDEDMRYDPATQKIGEGELDRRKQNALYVDVARDGTVTSVPVVLSEEQDYTELRRTKKMGWFARELVLPAAQLGSEYNQLIELLRELFDHPCAVLELDAGILPA